MIELKSVRVRKLTNGSNSGLLDLKVTVYGLTSSNTQRKLTAVIPSSGQPYWQETEFSGPRYDAKTNDEILSEFISANSSREKNRLGLSENKTLFRILQDPWEEKNPVLRNYGDDPYYLNNGAAIKIEWKKKLPISYSFSSEYLYSNGTNSAPTQILVTGDVFFDSKKPSDIELDFPNQFRLFYNPASFSLTSSVVDANLESTKRGFSTGFTNNNYVLSLEIENDIETLKQNIFVFPPVGFTEIFQDVSGYEYSDSNLKEINTPKDIIKQVIIIPKRISAVDETGELIEEKRRWSFDENLKPDYIKNLEPQPGYYFSQFYKFEGVSDDVIISKTIETWVKELALAYPTAKDYGLKLATPDYVPPTAGLIPDYSPSNGWGLLGDGDIYPDGTEFKFQQVGTSPNLPLLSSTASSATDSSTASEISKLKMLTQFPENWTIKADEKVPQFSIWIGEIQSDVAPEGFIYSDETDDMSTISPEYIEEGFEGQVEVISIIESDQEYDNTPESYAKPDDVDLSTTDNTTQTENTSTKPNEVVKIDGLPAWNRKIKKITSKAGWESDAANFISLKEGFKDKATFDVNRYRMGYGSEKILKNGKLVSVNKGDTCTKQEAVDTLATWGVPEFAKQIEKDLGSANWKKLTKYQKVALTSLGYNVGSAYIQARAYGKRIKEAISKGDMKAAAQEILNGPRTAKGQVLKGLVARRKEEAQLFLLPESKSIY
jgi:GH24 family phage-related lysozyme (muramidase)